MTRINKKGADREKKTRRQIVPVFICVLIFILLILSLVNLQIVSFKEEIINIYNGSEVRIAELLAAQIRTHCLAEDGQSGDAATSEYDYERTVNTINSYLQPSSGRFAVFECNGEILFAKTANATETLKSLRDSTKYWENLSSVDIETSSFSWQTQKGEYRLSIVTETSYILDNYGINQICYYLMFATGLMCMVLFMLIVVYVTKLDNTAKSLSTTRSELAARNRGFEQYIADDSRKQDSSQFSEKDFEASYTRLEKFFDISILRNLLSKSDAPDLKPIRMVIFSFLMNPQRYYSADEIMEYASCLSSDLHSRESIFELHKGVFALLIYRSSEAEASLRARTFVRALEAKDSERRLFLGFNTEIWQLGSGEASPIEEFERILQNG